MSKENPKHRINTNHLFFFIFFLLGGQSDFNVELLLKKYVEKGSSVTLFCEHNVAEKDLYKVSVFFYTFSFNTFL